MSETLYLIDDANKAANVTLTSSALKRILLDNDRALRLLAYGPFAPINLIGHDHGARRGGQIDEHYHSSSSVPYANAAGDPVDGGFPLYPAQPGVDFSSIPKLVDSKRIFIPGGVSSVTVRCTVWGLTSSTDISLRAEVRPLGQIGYASGRYPHTDATLTISDGDTGVLKMSVDLSSLGNASIDRDYELFIWLIENPSSGKHKLTSTIVVPDTDPGTRSNTSSPIEGVGVLHEVDPASILTNQFVTGELGDSWRKIVQQEVYSAYGAVSSLAGNLEFVNGFEPWESIVTYPHQHQGRRCIDADGLIFYDGPVRPVEFLSQSYLGDAGENASSQLNQNPYKGIRIHGNGDVASNSRFCHRISLPSGCRTISIQSAINFENADPITRLWVCAFLAQKDSSLTELGSNNLLTGIYSVGTSGGLMDALHADPLDLDGYYCLTVDPLPSSYYKSNTARKQNGLGLWTRHAERSTTQLLISGLSPIAGKYRTTQEVNLQTRHLQTGDYLLKVRFILQIGDFDSVLFDEDARLQWFFAKPLQGY